MNISIQEQEPVLAYWEYLASKTRYASYTSDIEKAVILKAHHLVPQPSTMLDIGCEAGRWSKLLADAGWKPICTDINAQALTLCQQRIPGATCVLASTGTRRLPAETASQGLALCVEVPQVMLTEWFLDEVSRVLQMRGLFVGTFLNHCSYRGLISHARATFRRHRNWYQSSYRTWCKELRARGFVVLHNEGFGWPPFGKISDSPLISVTTRIERALGLRKMVHLSPLVAFIARKEFS